MIMARIYTRTGDGGQTSLFDGTRTGKSDPRVGLYGLIDELNSWIGVCAAHLVPPPGTGDLPRDPAGPRPDGAAGLAEDLAAIQADLLEMGALLADPPRSETLAADPDASLPFATDRLEGWIDRMTDDLPPLKSFILPGGGRAAAFLHVARTVCRRAERRAVDVQQSRPFPSGVIAYLNRLGDFLFVAARWANLVDRIDDVIWPGRDRSRGGGEA
jgi:cob(I)alamin adenosyltransferase